MATLKPKPTLSDLQAYMKTVCKERGWDTSNHLEIFLLMTEEFGELAKAIRNHTKLYQETGKKDKDTRQELEGEFSDVLSYLLDLANYFEVDLEKAFRDKEEINAKRVWK